MKRTGAVAGLLALALATGVHAQSCRAHDLAPQTSADGVVVSARLSGGEDCAVGAPIELGWTITAGAPERPPLEPVKEELAKNSLVDHSFEKNGKRWLDDSKLPLIIVSVPEAARFQGDGFLVVPPRHRLPFGLDFDDDRTRVIFPLYLPESDTKGKVAVRPLAAGPFHLTARLVTASADGKRREAQVLADETRVLFDASSDIVVQDRVSPEKPQKTWLSNDGRFELRVFRGRFEVMNARTGGLLARRSGDNPRFSSTGRFVSYEWASNVAVLDVEAREDIDSTPIDDLASISFTENDSLIIDQAGGWGAFGVTPSLVDAPPPPPAPKPDKNAPDEGAPGDGQSVLGGAYAFGDGCHACRVDPRWLGVRWEEAAFDVADPERETGGAASRAYYSLLSPTLRFGGGVDPKILAAAGPAPRRGGLSLAYSWSKGSADAKSTPDVPWSLPPMRPWAENAVTGSGVRGAPVLRDFGGDERAPAPRTLDRSIADSLAGYDLPLAPAEPAARLADRTWRFSLDEGVRAAKLQAAYDTAVSPLIPKPSGPSKAYDVAMLAGKEGGAYGRTAGFWTWTTAARRVVLMRAADDEGGNGGFVTNQLCVFVAEGGPQLSRGQCFMEELVPENGVEKTSLDFVAEMVAPDRIALLDRKLRHLFLLDLTTLALTEQGLPLQATSDAQSLRLSTDGRRLVQINTDGEFFAYDLASKQLALQGLFVDDEFVAFTPQGYYGSTPEGGHYVYRYFPGLGEHFAFNEFASVYDRPDLVRAAARGEAVPAPERLVAPPTVEFDVAPKGAGFEVKGRAADADPATQLKSLRLFVDGVPAGEAQVSGAQAAFDQTVETPKGPHWVTAVAYNAQGFASVPKSARVESADGRAKGTLRFVGIAIDAYPKLPGAKLNFAKADVRLIDDALKGVPPPPPAAPAHKAPAKGHAKAHAKSDVKLVAAAAKAEAPRLYGSVETALVTDDAATSDHVLAALSDAVGKTGPDDTLLVSFAGHGLKGEDGRFYFVTVDAEPGRLAATALAWEKVAEVLGRSRGKVVVLLDACHAGLASEEAVVPNDAYADELKRKGSAGMVILAASKGRQFSQENPTLAGGHGLFSYAVAQALGAKRKTADRDGDGVIELDELYRYVKTWVAEAAKTTAHPQTPWLSHDEFVGQVPIL